MSSMLTVWSNEAVVYAGKFGLPATWSRPCREEEKSYMENVCRGTIVSWGPRCRGKKIEALFVGLSEGSGRCGEIWALLVCEECQKTAGLGNRKPD